MDRTRVVEVNGVEVMVVDRRVFKSTDDLWPGWFPLPNTNWFYKIPDAYQLLHATGHEAGKIDFAVPQDWFDRELERTGKPPRAWWSYEKNPFGEPLYIDTVRREFEKLLYEVWLTDEDPKYA